MKSRQCPREMTGFLWPKVGTRAEEAPASMPLPSEHFGYNPVAAEWPPGKGRTSSAPLSMGWGTSLAGPKSAWYPPAIPDGTVLELISGM